MKRHYQLILASIIGSILSISLFYVLGMNGRSLSVQHIEASPSAKFASLGGSSNDFTVAAEKTLPGVVHIKSMKSGKTYSSDPYGGMFDPFKDFFGDDFFAPKQYKSQPQMATGSGVIISADGFIITNNHVVAEADEISVTLYDNRSFPAKLIGTDPSTDLAVLQIDVKGLSPIPFVNSDNIKVGQFVLAVGNPFSLTSTATAGIVSARGRNLHILQDKWAIESFIQTDAAVNPGNSGGALVDMNGGLIGINTAIASPTGAYAGYSFAIPSNIVSKVFDDIMKFGVVQRGFLGISILPVDANLVKEKSLKVNEGVYVDSLFESGAASMSGVKAGDVIVSINGIEVKNPSDLQEIVGSKKPGDVLNLKIDRKGDEKQFDVTLKNKEGNTEVVKKERIEVLETLGIELQNLNDKELKKFEISGGAKIVKIKPGKLSKFTDIREGYIITKIDGSKVNKVEDVEKILSNKKGGIMLEGIYPGQPGVYYYAFGM